jgi:hypothetical protein
VREGYGACGERRYARVDVVGSQLVRSSKGGSQCCLRSMPYVSAQNANFDVPRSCAAAEVYV